MNRQKFYQNLGFESNPFEYTNADQEDHLANYFVKPPYFDSVFGDPRQPRSHVVFAPRGGGKTAQRLMIEKECIDSKVLSITYDIFDFSGVRKASDITLQHHLKRIIHLCLWGAIITLHHDPSLKSELSQYDKQNLVNLAEYYISGTTEASVQDTIHSLKSISQKVRDFWNDYQPFLKLGIKALFSRLFSQEADGAGEFSRNTYARDDQMMKRDLKLVSQIIRKLGYLSTYILIDRIDELTYTTHDAKASFELVRPLLEDLVVLETEGMGFKFFLWDQLEAPYQANVRTDRFASATLEWTPKMLTEMLRKRIRTFSNPKIFRLRQIVEETHLDIDTLIVVFANHSPRDAIRIGAKIMSEQQEINNSVDKISSSAVYRGIEKFSAERAREITTEKVLRELMQVHCVDFTIPYLARCFKESHANTRNRIAQWKREGAIMEIDRIVDPNASPESLKVKLFALRDIRVAKVILSEMKVEEFLLMKYKSCPTCDATVLRDWADEDSNSRCHDCQYDWNKRTDNIEEWRMVDIAKRNRSIQRQNEFKYRQMSFSEFLEREEKEEDNDWEGNFPLDER